MAMTLGVMLHVSAGTVGLLSGATALASQKGGVLHRQAGKFYLVSMLAMALFGFALAYMRSVNITMLAAGLTLYLVLSSWLSVQKRTSLNKRLDGVVTVIGGAVVSFGVYLCTQAYQGVTDSLGHFTAPVGIYFVFTAVLLVAVLFDLRWLLTSKPSARQRIVRHLWRMCVPLYVSASSLFNGQAKIFPEALQGTVFLELPTWAVLAALVFWLVKMSLKKAGNTSHKSGKRAPAA